MICFLIKTKADVTRRDLNHSINRIKSKLRHSADGLKVILAFDYSSALSRGHFKDEVWYDEIEIKTELAKSEWVPAT